LFQGRECNTALPKYRAMLAAHHFQLAQVRLRSSETDFFLDPPIDQHAEKYETKVNPQRLVPSDDRRGGVSCPQPALTQQITGTPGSPSATTTISGEQLPAPPGKFGGVIKESALASTPYWPPRVVPPKGAPNILLIMTDDQGYGVSGTFGGVIPTPALDRVAKAGLRYTQFHSTALCSPTRAALITRRNHHSVGFGIIGELSTGYPGYDSIIGQDNATIGEILKEHGYATSWSGVWTSATPPDRV
jgi:Sulfatase